MESEEIREALRPIQAAYLAEVRAIAKEVLAESDPEARDSLILESVDSNEWVIYTFRAQLVLALSENADEWYGLGIEPASDGVINWSQLAYAAMEADVWDYVNRHSGSDAQ